MQRNERGSVSGEREEEQGWAGGWAGGAVVEWRVREVYTAGRGFILPPVLRTGGRANRGDSEAEWREKHE